MQRVADLMAAFAANIVIKIIGPYKPPFREPRFDSPYARYLARQYGDYRA